MAKSTITPEVYQRMGLQQARLKSMPRGKFIQWLADYYQTAYNDGWNKAIDAYNAEHGGISISEDIDAAIYDTDALMDTLTSVRGIGTVLATRIIEAIEKDSA